MFIPSFSSKSQSLAFRKKWNDKSSNADSKEKTFKVLSLCCPLKKCAQQCLPRFLWHRCNFGISESLESSPVKMSQHFMTLQSASSFYTSAERLTHLKLLKCALDSDVWARCFATIFAVSFHYFKLIYAGSCSVKMSQAFHNPSINFHCTWER